MNAMQKSANIDYDTEMGNSFHDGLTILARIISRVYRRYLLISSLYIYIPFPSDGAPTYVEWPLICVDAAPNIGPCSLLLLGKRI